MAKEMTAAQVAAWFAAQGLEVPETLVETATNEARDALESYLYDHLSSIESETDRIAAATESLEWAESVAANMLSFDSFESGKQGRGDSKVLRRKVVLDLPEFGTLTIMLDRDIPKGDK